MGVRFMKTLHHPATVTRTDGSPGTKVRIDMPEFQVSPPTGFRDGKPPVTNDPPFTTPRDVHENLARTVQRVATRELVGPAGTIVVNIGQEDEQHWLGQGYVDAAEHRAARAEKEAALAAKEAKAAPAAKSAAEPIKPATNG